MKRAASPASRSSVKRATGPITKVQIRMVEFFSGIGGMRAAIEGLVGQNGDADMEIVSCTAYEISEKANDVYRHNFPEKGGKDFCVRTKLVEQLKIKDIPPSNLWTMSPPCQPFTRTRMAKQRDLEDKRTAGFVAIMDLLQKMELPERPTWILLENVEGFAGSQAHKLMYNTLLHCGYSWVDGMLSPIELGIPNHRKRYFALCEKSGRFFQRDQASLEQFDGTGSLKTLLKLNDFQRQNLSNFISPDTDATELIIPDAAFSKEWAKDLPVVSHLDTQSHCFTAAYSRQLHRATGSLLLMEPDRKESVEISPIDRSDMLKMKGKLRRFSTEELLKLFGFPQSFSFPKDMDLSYKYKLIGNSISVVVVKELMKHLLDS